MRAAQRLQINVALESVNTLKYVSFSRSENGDKRLLRGAKILLNG